MIATKMFRRYFTSIPFSSSNCFSGSNFIGPVLIIIFSVIYGSNGREGVNNTLKCYQCQIQGTNETVCDNDLFTCPNNQAYDRCMINTKRNATTGEITIIKGCALAPCELEKEVESIIFSGKCDLNRRGADCVKCCLGDGCNKRSSLAISIINHSPAGILISTFILALIIMSSNLNTIPYEGCLY